MTFTQVINSETGQIEPTLVEYVDDQGLTYCVPEGHRIWIEIYEPWLAAGNTPLPAA